MNERKTRILTKLAEEGDKIAAFFGQIPSEKWDTEVHSDGMKWTIRAVMYHLLDSELSFNPLFRNVLKGGSGAPEDFKIDEHNNSRVGNMGGWNPETFAESFLVARRKNIALFEDATDDDLDRAGRHPAMGIRNLEDMLKLTFLHNRMHQKEVQHILEKVANQSHAG